MRVIICMIIWITLFLYVAGITITFKPLVIEFKSLRLALGLLFVVIGFVMIEVYYYNKGQSDTIKAIEDRLKKEEQK